MVKGRRWISWDTKGLVASMCFVLDVRTASVTDPRRPPQKDVQVVEHPPKENPKNLQYKAAAT